MLEATEYIHNRINDKIISKIIFHSNEIKYYFNHRHVGLAGIENEQVVSLVRGAIRNLKVWKEIDNRNKGYIAISRF